MARVLRKEKLSLYAKESDYDILLPDIEMGDMVRIPIYQIRYAEVLETV